MVGVVAVISVVGRHQSRPAVMVMVAVTVAASAAALVAAAEVEVVAVVVKVVVVLPAAVRMEVAMVGRNPAADSAAERLAFAKVGLVPMAAYGEWKVVDHSLVGAAMVLLSSVVVVVVVVVVVMVVSDEAAVLAV